MAEAPAPLLLVRMQPAPTTPVASISSPVQATYAIGAQQKNFKKLPMASVFFLRKSLQKKVYV
jgi:hypothetical protein